MNKKLIILFCLIIYLLITFGTEIFYRDRLYEISVEYIENISQKGFFHYFYFFWSIIFLFSMMGIGLFITLFFYPINTFFIYVSIQIILVFIMCILKSLYSNPRPYWDIYLKNQGNRTDTFLPTPTECDGEFGNPSGHALLSTYLLYLWDLFINSNYYNNKISGKKKIVIKYITLILSIICIIFVTYSRINRQVHSFNQIIFGATLGFAIFFFFSYYFEINKISTNDFLNNLVKFKFILIPILFILFTISVILGLTRHNEKEELYLPILLKYCGFDKEQIFGKNTAFHSSLIFVIIGFYFGILFLKYKLNKYYPKKENRFYNWNKGRKRETLLIFFLSFILPALSIFIVSAIPFNYYLIKCIFAALFYFIYGFFSLGICFYYSCVKFKREEDMEELLINNKENEEGNIDN